MITGNFGSVPLVHIGHDNQRAKHQLGTFVTSLATIFSFNMTGRVAMSISEAFFFLQLQAGTVRNSYSASAHCNFSTSDQLVKRCSCSASLRAPRMSDPGRSRRPEERPKRLCIWSLMWWLRKNGRKKVIQGSEKYFELTRNILPGNSKMIAK